MARILFKIDLGALFLHTRKNDFSFYSDWHAPNLDIKSYSIMKCILYYCNSHCKHTSNRPPSVITTGTGNLFYESTV